MTIADMTMAEARRDERVRAFLRARICFNNNASTIDCTVKNISASGAKIEMSSAVSVPSEFDLDVPQKGRIYRARLMWRDASSLGVQFVDRSADTEQLDSHAARLQPFSLNRMRSTRSADARNSVRPSSPNAQLAMGPPSSIRPSGSAVGERIMRPPGAEQNKIVCWSSGCMVAPGVANAVGQV